MVAPDPDEKMTRHELARAADVAAAAFRQGGWRWTGGQHVDDFDRYEPSPADIALALSGMMRDVAESTDEFKAITSGRLRVERVIDRVDERVTTSILLELGESAEPLPEGVTPLPYDPDESEAHAPDPVDDTTTELGPLDDITYRSTGRGAYDVIRTRAEGPDTVLATVLFSEGVRGRVHGLEALVRSLRQTTQDVQP